MDDFSSKRGGRSEAFGAFDDLPSAPQISRGESAVGIFDDLPTSNALGGAPRVEDLRLREDGSWTIGSRSDFGAGLREANDPMSTRRNATRSPAQPPLGDEGVVGNALRYPKEFGKAIVRGAADLAGTALKFGAAAQTVAARDMQRYVQRRLDAIDRMDRGEPVDPNDDPEGYATKLPQERRAIKQRLTSRLTQFDLPGGVQDRDLYQAGSFLSQAGQKAAPAAPGWEDSTTAHLGQGVGSVVAGLPVAAGGVGAGALVFGAAGGGEALERAIQDKASPDDQLKAAILGTGPGMTDVAPIELLLRSNRLTAPFSGKIANAVARIGGQAFAEGVQEGGQQFLQNLIAREVYKPDQDLQEDVLPNTGMGAGVGGITATAVELARLFGGRRGAHAPAAGQSEVGSATGVSAAAPDLPAGGVPRDWVGETGRNALASGWSSQAAGDNVSSVARGAFDDLIPGAGNALNPSYDNADFRKTEVYDDGLGPETLPTNALANPGAAQPTRNALMPSLQDFGLSGKGDRLAYGGTGEAPRKRQNRVDRSQLEVSAERLMRDVRAYEDEMRASGVSAADIAASMEETFGFDVTPDQIARGNGWWRVEETIARETGKTSTGQIAKVTFPPEVEDLLRGEWRNLSSPDVARRLKESYGLNVSVGIVNSRRADLGVRSTQRGNHLPREVVNALRSWPVTDMTGEEAARYLAKHFSREVTGSAVNRWRRTDAVKRAAIHSTIMDSIDVPELRGMSDTQAADFINAKLGRHNVRLTASQVAKMRRAADARNPRLLPGQRESLQQLLRDPAIAAMSKDDAAAAIRQMGIPVSGATVRRVRLEMGEAPRPRATITAREGRDDILAFLRSEEARGLTHAEAAKRAGTDREYVRNLRREYGLQRPDERAYAEWTGAPVQFLVSDEGQALSHRAMAAELNRRFPGNEFTADAVRSRRREYGLTGDRNAPDARELLDQPAFNDSAYREASAELQMLVGGKSKGISDERYARLVSERFGRHFSTAEIKELRERAREAYRQLTGKQPLFALGGSPDGAFDDIGNDAQDIEAAKAAGMWPAGSESNPQDALLLFRQARIVAEIAREIEGRRLPDLAIIGEAGAGNRARAGRPAARQAIDIARRMDDEGSNRNEIWQATADYLRDRDPALIGAFKGADGQWRVEVSDLRAAFIGRSKQGGAKLDKILPDMLRHDELFLTYPDLARVRAGWETGARAYARALAKGLPTGLYVSSTKSPDGSELIAAGAPSTGRLLPPIMHETQHAIQQREGFARGSSRGSDADAYVRQAGEVEARNVEARLSMTEEQRRQTPPWETEDVAGDQQLVSYFGDQAESYGDRRRGGARPINWNSPSVRAEMEGRARRRSGALSRVEAIGPMGGRRGPDFAWPPAALQMLRENEGRSFADIARALSERFGTTVTRDMVAGKVRRLREMSNSEVPLLAASNDPEGWFARFRRARNAKSEGSSAPGGRLDQTSGEVSQGAPGESETPGSGAGRDATGGARGSVARFDVGRHAGRVVETPNSQGLRQRRYYLFSPTSELPALTNTPGVALRVLKSMRSWIAKAHVSETSPDQWRVLSVNVRGNRQRRGIGTELYDALDRDLGAKLGPSDSMTRKLFRFWQKRDAAAVDRYQRIGDIYHSPAALRSMKRVNDELLRNPPSARDAAAAKRFADTIDQAVARAEDVPEWAKSDVDGRNYVTNAIRNGETVSIPAPVVDRVLEGIAAAYRRLPEGAEAGALAQIAPLRRAPAYPGSDVVATFKMPNGSTFEVELPLRVVTTTRAFYDNFTGRIALTRFGLFSGIDQSIAGEIDHEAVHLLRRQGVLRGAVWDSLVSHAHSLRLLDGTLATYLKMVGDPSANKADPSLSLRDAYEGLYKNTTDFAERMDQEAVAHMRELYTHGQLLPAEVAPVRDILDKLNNQQNPGAAFDESAFDDLVSDSEATGAFDDLRPVGVGNGAIGAFDDLAPRQSYGNANYRELDSAVTGGRRRTDALGFYSKLDEVLASLRPTDNVTAETLKKRGVKQAEMQARGIADLLAEGKAAGVSDLQRVATDYPASISEARYGSWTPERERQFARLDELRERIAVLDREFAKSTGAYSSPQLLADPRYKALAAEFDALTAEMDAGRRERTRWSAFSLDPSNPTYRETVLHLPSRIEPRYSPKAHPTRADKWALVDASGNYRMTERGTEPAWYDSELFAKNSADTLARIEDQQGITGMSRSGDYRSGHWSEPNVIAHARTSLLRDADGRLVFHVDELQSDWGQKLRDTGGGRDAARIEKLRAEIDAAREARDAFLMGEPLAFLRRTLDYPTKTNAGEVESFLSRVARGEFGVTPDQMDEASGFRLDQRLSTSRIERLDAEIRTNEAAAPGHPLVNKTDQWVDTALRRMIRQAIDAGADYIAIPSGQTVLNYGMGGEPSGIRYAYDQMYPKNLRNILRRIDPSIEGRKSADLRNPEVGKVSPQLESATVFPLTGLVKGDVLADGLPLFALSSEDPRITTPGGEMDISVRPQVIDLAELKQASGDLQPRDRSRAESAIGVRERATALDPARLMPERVSDNGAPVVAKDNTVLSGNGRVMSLGEVYRDPALADRAAAYREAVIAYAERNGLGSEAASMRHPVLVSRIDEDMSRADLVRFADLSNRSSIAEMASPERAMRDARALGPEILGLYRGGDFTSADNRDFYRAFMDGAVSSSERGSVSRDGALTKEGEDRMAAAVLAGAYGDPAMLSRMLESTDDNIRSVTGAMRDAAGGFVRLKQAIASGEVDAAFDITPQLAETARRIADLRSRRVSLKDFLSQQDAFNRLDPIVEDLLRGFHSESLTRARSREKLTELLASYAEEAVKHKQNGLIPDETTPAAIVDYASKRGARTIDELVDSGTSSAGRPDDRARSQDRGSQPDANGARQSGQSLQQGLTPPQSRNALARATPPQQGNALAPARRNALLGRPPAPPAQPPAGGSGGPPSIPPLVPVGPTGRQQPNPATVRALNSWKTRLLETFQNSQERMRILVDRVGQGRLNDSEDPYLRSTLYHGRLDARVRFGNELAETIVSNINRQARVSGIGHEEMRDLVNDYLIARHAPERNALHGNGAAGMTNAEARQALSDINNRADAAEIRAIADQVRSLHEMSLDALRGADVISTELYNRLRSAYQHHVPLNRLVPGQPDVAGGVAGRGFDVYSSGIKRAKGSGLEVLDVLGNVLTNFEQAMIRSEKNLVDLSSLAFLRSHQADLAGFMEEQRPPVIGTGPNGQPIYQQTSDPRVLHLFERGKPIWIRFSDARLASAFRANNSESLPPVLRWIAAVTRFYSALQTRFNPEFAFPNKLRDLQETITYMGAQRQIGARGAIKVLARDPSSTKAILDYLAGRSTAGARAYQEMINAGGTTGGMGLSTRESVQLKIDDLDRLAQSSPRRFARRVVELVDDWNTIFEDSTRLSVYRAARDQGLSRERAAFLAKEASINFNRMGTAGPVVNGLYMFANASIQGSVKMIRSLRNPKVAAAVGVTIAAAVVAVFEWNDELDPQWRDKVSKWDRLNSLPIVLPNEDGEGVRYVSIPVSWGMKPIMVAAAAAYDAAKGIAVDWATALSDITTAMIEAYNPVGGTDLGQAVTPTIGDTPLDIMRNRSWSGGAIRPDQDRNLPYDKQYFLKLKDTKTGRASIKATETLRDYTGLELSPADLNYAIEQYIGGAGRSARKTFDTLIGFGTGQQPPADEYPFLSRFYRERTQEEVGRGAGGMSEELTERLRQQSRARFDQRSHVDDILRSIEDKPAAEKREMLKGLRKDRTLYNAVRDGIRLQEKGLTWQERQLLRLGADNGERARFIADELRPLNSAGRSARLRELHHKELVTPEVLQQIRSLLAGRKPRLPGDYQPTPALPMPPQNRMLQR